MNRTLSLLTVLIGFAVVMGFAVLPARAAITLHIDTTAQEFYFSGSDAGLAFSSGPETDYIIDWSNTGDIGGTIAISPIASSFTLSLGTLTSADLSQFALGYSSIILRISDIDDETPVTVTADHTIRYSYAGYDAWRISFLEGLAANPQPYLANPGNTGFSDLDTVPEPGTITLAALGLGLLAHHLLRRRRRHT